MYQAVLIWKLTTHSGSNKEKKKNFALSAPSR
jgi:hypothetical protein